MFYKEGFQISLNSDDPPFFSTHLKREYDIVQEAYAYSDADMHRITTMALESAFVDNATRDRLLEKVKTC